MNQPAILNLSSLAPESIAEQAAIRRDAALCDAVMSRLEFNTVASQSIDLRCLKGLEGCPDPIRHADVVVDSDMSYAQAFERLSPDCPDEVLACQELLPVYYYGADGLLHRGQVVIHSALVPDVEQLFELLREYKIPVHSMIPAAHSSFRDDQVGWSDLLSMEANNGYSFNYRKIVTATGETKRLSLHALGLALDINPAWNPCYGDPEVHLLEFRKTECAAGYRAQVPSNGRYDLGHPGSFHNRHPAVVLLKDLGWIWGGEWGDPKDLHHFQKIPAELKDWVARFRG